MNTKEFLARVMDLRGPWRIAEVEIDDPQRHLRVFLRWNGDIACGTCSRMLPLHDTVIREPGWRHLDLFQYQVHVLTHGPLVNCPDHGITPAYNHCWRDCGADTNPVLRRRIQDRDFGAFEEDATMTLERREHLRRRFDAELAVL